MKKYYFALLVFMMAVSANAVFLVDDCETGTLTNSISGIWQALDDGYSSITFTPDAAPAYSGNFCRDISWFFRAGNANGPYVMAQTSLNNTWAGVDVSAYEGVRFRAKGTGVYDILLPIQGTRTTFNHYSDAFIPTASWQLYEIPFSKFTQTWGTPVAWDPATVYAVSFQPVGTAGSGGSLQIDNLEFYTQAEAQATPTDPNIILPQPKVNQEGYLTGEKKYFCVVTNTASASNPYYILDASNNTVYTSAIAGTPFNDSLNTGEGVWTVDFSSFNTPGRYIVTVNEKASYPFNIAANVYDVLFKDALRCFYLIRCGIAENDGITGINRPACHTVDALIRGTAGSGDFTGGWHNADDFGKYVNETAISVAYMLWLYELKTNHMSGVANNIPETGNGYSDLLNEARWGLNWLLKMQRPDGTVLHKVDSEPNLFSCISPDSDNSSRYAEFQAATNPQVPSTIDAADFAGVMAQASRVFQPLDPSYSAQCSSAAQKAWVWAQANTMTAQSDPYFIDPAQWQEYMWAEAEMARTLNSQTLRDNFSAMTDANALGAAGWNDPQIFGYLTLYKDPNSPQALKDKINLKTVNLCQSLLANISNSGYMADLQDWEYYWESNETLMHRACAMLFGYEMSGNTSFKDGALKQLNYMLGLNSLNKSFVMSHGSNPMMKPWNCVYLYYNKSLPGWCAGGANQYTTGADQLLINVINAGTPKAKCYVDDAQCGIGSWASNEGGTSESAALVFLSGYFYSVTYAQPPTPTLTVTPTSTRTMTRTSTATITATLTVMLTATATPTVTEGKPETQTGGAGVYPSPCDLGKGAAGITFFSLPAEIYLEVYSMSGEMTYKTHAFPVDGKFFWRLKPAMKNKQIAQGVYVYFISDGKGNTEKGKLVIIR